MNHLMLDIETAGKGATAMILSIGGAVFNLEDGVIEQFHIRPNLAEQTLEGRNVDIDTIIWWLDQEEGARREAFTGERFNRGHIGAKIADVWSRHNVREVWAHGASFDIVILEDYLQGLHPWSFRNISDTRLLGKYVGVDRVTPLVPHNAECDAVAQAVWAVAMLKKLQSLK